MSEENFLSDADMGVSAENPRERLVILHAGDVFLDGPVGRLRRDTKEQRRKELREAFESFLQIVDEEKADAVLFSGNLIDAEYVGDDTLTFLLRAFEKRPACHFVIAPGPHDPYDNTSIYRSKRFPRNVHIFFSEVLGTFTFAEPPMTFYGWGYVGKTCTNAPLSGAHRASGDRFTMLCGYTRLDGTDETLAPVDEEAIASFGAHYTALSGAVHDGFHRAGDGVCAYSGSFEGRDGETTAQAGGYIRIVATRADKGWSIEAERRPLDTYSYVTERLDVSHLSSVDDVRARLATRIAERGYGPKTVLRVVLYGSVPLSAHFEGVDAENYGLYSVWIEDHTVPTDATDVLLREMTARGELYRYFHPKMMSGTEEDRARAARAFRIGYAALLGEDFAKY